MRLPNWFLYLLFFAVSISLAEADPAAADPVKGAMDGAASGRLQEVTAGTYTLALPDGRLLGFSQHGDPDGVPIFYMHGNPGSRRDAEMLGDVDFSALGVRFIAVDRPGIGLSSFQPARTLGAWPTDVAALADALRIDRFAVMGISAGGASALAVAHALPRRVTALTIVSGLAPLNAVPGASSTMGPSRTYMSLAHSSWLLLRPLLFLMSAGLADPDGFLTEAKKQMPEADRRILENPRVAKGLMATFQESFAPGTAGLAWDAMLAARFWPFEIREITLPVAVWHGTDDMNVPFVYGRYLAERLPNSRPFFYSGEGHLSLGVGRFGAILHDLTAQHQRAIGGENHL
jgi:pimeloyl-ACP methyl ester carboxylesterase